MGSTLMPDAADANAHADVRQGVCQERHQEVSGVGVGYLSIIIGPNSFVPKCQTLPINYVRQRQLAPLLPHPVLISNRREFYSPLIFNRFIANPDFRHGPIGAVNVELAQLLTFQ